jgi:hypothetical protein
LYEILVSSTLSRRETFGPKVAHKNTSYNRQMQTYIFLEAAKKSLDAMDTISALKVTILWTMLMSALI